MKNGAFFFCNCGCGLLGHKSRKYPHGFIILETGCHVWTGAKDKDGYGVVNVNGQPLHVHRHFYAKRHGPIPDGMMVLHTCDNPPCIRDEHLFLGTNEDNVHDMMAKGRHGYGLTPKKDACKNGHPFSGENVYMWHGEKHCRACRKVAREACRQRAAVRFLDARSGI